MDDVELSSGDVLRFEVRFGREAKSRKVPEPHKCGMVQVELGSQNTRQVKITSRSGKKPTVRPSRRLGRVKVVPTAKRGFEPVGRFATSGATRRLRSLPGPRG